MEGEKTDYQAILWLLAVVQASKTEMQVCEHQPIEVEPLTAEKTFAELEALGVYGKSEPTLLDPDAELLAELENLGILDKGRSKL